MSKNDKFWTTRDGEVLLVKDLENSHLLNIANLLEKLAEHKRHRDALFYLNTNGPDGEYAQYSFTQEVNRVSSATWEDYLDPIYDDVIKEILARKLSHKPAIPYGESVLFP